MTQTLRVPSRRLQRKITIWISFAVVFPQETGLLRGCIGAGFASLSDHESSTTTRMDVEHPCRPVNDECFRDLSRLFKSASVPSQPRSSDGGADSSRSPISVYVPSRRELHDIQMPESVAGDTRIDVAKKTLLTDSLKKQLEIALSPPSGHQESESPDLAREAPTDGSLRHASVAFQSGWIQNQLIPWLTAGYLPTVVAQKLQLMPTLQFPKFVVVPSADEYSLDRTSFLLDEERNRGLRFYVLVYAYVAEALDGMQKIQSASGLDAGGRFPHEPDAPRKMIRLAVPLSSSPKDQTTTFPIDVKFFTVVGPKNSSGSDALAMLGSQVLGSLSLSSWASRSTAVGKSKTQRRESRGPIGGGQR